MEALRLYREKNVEKMPRHRSSCTEGCRRRRKTCETERDRHRAAPNQILHSVYAHDRPLGVRVDAALTSMFRPQHHEYKSHVFLQREFGFKGETLAAACAGAKGV